MAVEFNNQSVAENFAVRTGIRLMMTPEYDFLQLAHKSVKRGAELQQWFRDTLIQLVLATDMSRHFQLVGEFNAQLVQNKEVMKLEPNERWKGMTESQRMLSLKMALKVWAPTHTPHTSLQYLLGRHWQ